MPKKFARRVDVCPGCQRHGGKGVAARTLNLSYAFGPIRASLIDGAKLRQLHCGFRIFVRLFFKKSTRKQKTGRQQARNMPLSRERCYREDGKR
jgi:hypothetical protein